MIKSILKKTPFYKIYLKNKLEQLNTEKITRIIETNKRVRGPLMEKYLPKNGIGAELGVFRGHFSRVLLDFPKTKRLHLIAPWYFLTGNWTWSGGNNSTVDALCLILKDFEKELSEKRVFIHVEDDRKVLNEFEDNYFDWVYIDSSHSYQHTVDELKILKNKVKNNGIICGDDWRPDPKHRHHGVYVAVKEFMEENNCELLYSNKENLQWFFKFTK